MFEWQKHSKDATNVPHFQDLLDFMNLRAQASETSSSENRKPSKDEVRKNFQSSKQVTSFATNTDTFEIQVCVLCKPERHLLFNCNKFKKLPHDGKLSILKTHKPCHNCLQAGHYAQHCKSIHCCQKCHGQHHTLLHIEQITNTCSRQEQLGQVTTHATIGAKS